MRSGQLRVLVVIPGDGAGASMIFCRRLAAALQALGVSVKIFHLGWRNGPGALLREWPRFRREVASVNPHLIHAQYGTITALFCALASGRPLCVTFRGSDLNPTPSLPGVVALVKQTMSQLAALRARGIICVSEELRGRLWWRRARAVVIPTGVDLEVFRPLSQAIARKELGMAPQERLVLFYSGRHPLAKRLDLAEAAMLRLQARVPGARLLIMDGTVDPDRVPLYMNAADCLLFTSDYEGSPTVIQEAKACDLPVVSVEVGDVVEQLAGVRNCRIVSRDPDDIAHGLAEVILAGERSDGSGFLAESALAQVGARTLALYRQMVESRCPRPASR